MNHVRPLVAADIPALAELHASVFSDSSALSRAQRRQYLGEVFLESPWQGTALSSLVSEDTRHGVTGFLGVVPRTMSLGGTSGAVADMTEAQLVAQGEGYMFALVGCAVCAVITGIAALFIRFSPQQVAQAQEAEKAAQNA